ncbi:phosphoribosyltransferase, partial [Streptomyces sp. NPDC005780]
PNVYHSAPRAGGLVEPPAGVGGRPPAPGGGGGAPPGGGGAGGPPAAVGTEHGAGIGAVVSRGGRPDLAGDSLGDVRAPTLLIVGGDDTRVLELNRQAQARLHCENRLDVVTGATHLFEEPGALDEVAELARDWFTGHLTA